MKAEERGGYNYWLGSNLLEYSSNAYDLVLFDNDNEPVKVPGYRIDGLTDRAIQYIDSHRNNPFFLFLSFLEPHIQNHTNSYPAPYNYEHRYISSWIPPDLLSLNGSTHQHLAGYYGMVKRLDEALGRLIEALMSLDIFENTIVLFASDHGDHFMTRNTTHKNSIHESSIRLPVVIHGELFNKGLTINNPVSLIDLAPTLLDACGITVPKHMMGKSIVSLVKGD